MQRRLVVTERDPEMMEHPDLGEALKIDENGPMFKAPDEEEGDG